MSKQVIVFLLTKLIKNGIKFTYRNCKNLRGSIVSKAASTHPICITIWVKYCRPLWSKIFGSNIFPNFLLHRETIFGPNKIPNRLKNWMRRHCLNTEWQINTLMHNRDTDQATNLSGYVCLAWISSRDKMAKDFRGYKFTILLNFDRKVLWCMYV